MSAEAINCIIDSRVSTNKQLAGHGLDDQEAICVNYAKTRGWNVLKIYAKAHSGRKDERADFDLIVSEIIAMQRKGVVVNYYLTKSIDRFTRNGLVTYDQMKSVLMNIGVQLVDVHGIIQPDRNTLEHLDVQYKWSRYSPSESAETIEAMRGEAEVRDALTRMIGAEIGLTRQGYSMRQPNDGYRNKKEIIDGQEMSVIAQDSDRAFYYKEMFKLRASGQFSDKEIVEKVNAIGFKSKPRKRHLREGKKSRVIGMTTPKLLTVKQLQRVVEKTMYAGIKLEEWNKDMPVRAVFASGERPIVSIEEFNKASRGKRFIKVEHDGTVSVLHNVDTNAEGKKVRKKYNQNYKYDKMVTCHLCGKPLKNSGNKGNKSKSGKGYHGYHCDRIVDGEKHYYRIPKENYEQQISDILKRVKFSDDFSQKLEERLLKKYREREKEVLGQSIQMGENVTSLKREQESLMNDFSSTDSQLIKNKLTEKIEGLEERISKATEQRDKIEIEERDIKSFVKYATDLVEHPVKLLANNRNPYTQQKLFSLVFAEPLTHHQVVNGTPKLSFIFKLSGTKHSTESSLVTH